MIQLPFALEGQERVMRLHAVLLFQMLVMQPNGNQLRQQQKLTVFVHPRLRVELRIHV
jgi:hypothetical protein